MRSILLIFIVLSSQNLCADECPDCESASRIHYPIQSYLLIGGGAAAGAFAGYDGLHDRKNPNAVNGTGAALVGAGLGAILGIVAANWLYKPVVYVSQSQPEALLGMSCKF